MTSTDTLRNAELSDLVALLKDQHSRRLDVVAPARNVWFQGGQLRIAGAEPVFDEDGVTDVNGLYRPTAVFDDGVSEKLGMPRAYLRRLRDEGRTHLLDQNLNELVHGWKDAVETFLDKAYMERVIRDLEEKSGEPVAAVEAQKKIEAVSVKLAYGKDAAAGILEHFLTAGDLTKDGVFNAVTSYAQTVEDADKAYAMEGSATRVLDLV